MRIIGTKGFKVVQDKNGKATLERVAYYGSSRRKKEVARKVKAWRQKCQQKLI